MGGQIHPILPVVHTYGRMGCSAQAEGARRLVLDDLREDVEQGWAPATARQRELFGDALAVRRMAARQHALQAPGRLRVAEGPPGGLVIAPLDREATLVGGPEAAPETVDEAVQIPAEVAPGPLTASPIRVQKSSSVPIRLPSST